MIYKIFAYIIPVLLIFVVITSCSKEPHKTTLKGMEEFLADDENELSSNVIKNDISFTIRYEPIDLIIQKQQGENLKSLQELEAAKKDYPDLEYYSFEIGSEIKNTREHLNSLYEPTEIDFQYYSDFGIQKDIFIVQNMDTISCVYLHREVSESITNTFRYLLGFEMEKVTNIDRQIKFISKFEGIQQVDFRISNQSIASIPHLK